MAREEGTPRLRIALTLVAVLLAAVMLAVVTYRTAFRVDALRSQSIFEATLGLAYEKVDRVDRAIVEADDAIVSLGDNGRADEIPRRWRLIARQTPTVAHVFVLDAGLDREIVAAASRSPGPQDDSVRSLILRRIVADLELSALPVGQIKHLHKAYDGTFQLLTYFRAQGVAGVERIVVIRHELEAVARELLPLVVPDVVPGGAPQTSKVNVVDDDGRILFGPPLGKTDLVVAKRFPTTLYAWRLQVAPISSDELAVKTRRRRVLEMSLLSLSIVVVLAGVAVILVVSAQERKLVQLRADFVANVSHELKTPLSLVRMFGEMLMSGRVASEEKRSQYLSIIVRESERLTALIENVLDFARFERGKVAYDFEDADLGVLVSKAVDACRYRAEAENMRLEVHIDDALPIVRVDERALQLAVINLIENAVKYAPGTEVVSVEVKKENEHALIAVQDRGPGIDPADRKRIFQRFYRGKGHTERQVRGSGIGLALVEHIAQAHGGSAAVERVTPQPAIDEAKGARFVIRIPLGGRSG